MGFAEHPAAHAAQATSGVEQALEWLLARQGDPLLDLPPTTTQYSNTRVQGAGVAGLLHREVQRAAATDQSLDEAFRDLDALMIQAGDMVALAQRFRGQLLAAEGENAEARALEADLVAMGIANPITRDAAGKAFHRELARQVHRCWDVQDVVLGWSCVWGGIACVELTSLLHTGRDKVEAKPRPACSRMYRVFLL